MTITEGIHEILDEYTLTSNSNFTAEEVKVMLILTGKAQECNGITYVNTNKVPLETFNESLLKEAQAYIKRNKVLEFIQDNQGCKRSDIREFLKTPEWRPSYDAIDLILTILTEENPEIYEDDDDTLWSI